MVQQTFICTGSGNEHPKADEEKLQLLSDLAVHWGNLPTHAINIKRTVRRGWFSPNAAERIPSQNKVSSQMLSFRTISECLYPNDAINTSVRKMESLSPTPSLCQLKSESSNDRPAFSPLPHTSKRYERHPGKIALAITFDAVFLSANNEHSMTAIACGDEKVMSLAQFTLYNDMSGW